MASIYQRGRRQWISYYQAGRRRFRPLRYPDGSPVFSRKDALLLKADVDRQLRHSSPAARHDLTLADLIPLYLDATHTRRGARTQIEQRSKLRVLEGALGAAQVDGLSPQVVEAGLTHLFRTRRLSPATYNEYLTTLRAVSRWTVLRGYCLEDFTKGLGRLKEVERTPTALSRAQREQLLEAARTHPLLPMLATAYYAGLRWQELATLEWEDIDFERKTITVRPKAHWAPKSKRSRVIPLHQGRLAGILKGLRQDRGACFPIANGTHHVGQPYRVRARYRITKLLTDLGVYKKGEGWHLLRRTFASHLLQTGVSLEKVMRWLGHSRGGLPEPTWRYVRWIEGYDPDIEKL